MALRRRDYGYGDGYCYHRGGRGMAATGIGLGAAGLGIAIFGGMAVAFGLNAASKARYKAAENAANGNTKAIELVAAHLAQERNTRETWQNVHTPTMTQYVDVRAGAGAGAGANALANAEAVAAILNGGSRSGQVCPQPVALYQPAMPCACNTCAN